MLRVWFPTFQLVTSFKLRICWIAAGNGHFLRVLFTLNRNSKHCTGSVTMLHATYILQAISSSRHPRGVYPHQAQIYGFYTVLSVQIAAREAAEALHAAGSLINVGLQVTPTELWCIFMPQWPRIAQNVIYRIAHLSLFKGVDRKNVARKRNYTKEPTGYWQVWLCECKSQPVSMLEETRAVGVYLFRVLLKLWSGLNNYFILLSD